MTDLLSLATQQVFKEQKCNVEMFIVLEIDAFVNDNVLHTAGILPTHIERMYVELLNFTPHPSGR